MRPRNRRLHSEYEDMLELAKSSSMVSFTSSGIPPVQYNVTITCLGLTRRGDAVIKTAVHEFDLILTENFPLVPPEITWLTPIFHPNIKPPNVCSGDIWFPAMPLADLVVELCKLVQYKSFNVYDPLNEEASVWLLSVLRSAAPGVPVDDRPIIDQDFKIGVSSLKGDEGPDDGVD